MVQNDTVSMAESHNRVQQGCLHSVESSYVLTIPLVGEDMRCFITCHAPCLRSVADNINVDGLLSETYKAVEVVRINLAAESIVRSFAVYMSRGKLKNN